MNLPKYTKEELEFIEKWALPEDIEMDEEISKDPELQKKIYSLNGTRISALKVATSRKALLEARGIFLDRISDYVEDTSPITPPVYTKEELAIIEEWGIPSDKDFDTKRRTYGLNGKRTTALDLALIRKEILREQGLKLERRNGDEEAD